MRNATSNKESNGNYKDGARAMPSRRDIKVLLVSGYAVAYPLAVAPPIYIDPRLTSHVFFNHREYPFKYWCILIYLFMMLSQLLMLKAAQTALRLYASVLLFLLSIVVSLPIFRPEFPHGNLFAVGITTTFMSAFTIFVWSLGAQLTLHETVLKSAGEATLEYVKTLFAFVRQGAFAGVVLFGALFFAAYRNGFEYTQSTVKEPIDRFMLDLNTGFQIGCYAIYAVVGAIRYFFMMSLTVLAQFKTVARQLDERGARAAFTEKLAISNASVSRAAGLRPERG